MYGYFFILKVYGGDLRGYESVSRVSEGIMRVSESVLSLYKHVLNLSQGVLRVSESVLRVSESVSRVSEGVSRLSETGTFFGAIFEMMNEIRDRESKNNKLFLKINLVDSKKSSIFAAEV